MGGLRLTIALSGFVCVLVFLTQNKERYFRNVEHATQTLDDHIFEADTWKRWLLITGHGNQNNLASNDIRVYDFNSTHHFASDGVALSPSLVKNLDLQNLRGIKVVGNVLFLVSAHSTKSKIVMTDKCIFQKKVKVAKTFTIDSLNHPYGIAYSDGKLYITNQNTDQVLLYSLHDGFGASALIFAKVPHPRGIVIDISGKIWVASNRGHLFVFASSGELVKKLKIPHPVGVTIDVATGNVIVGSVHGSNSGIYIIDHLNLKVITKLIVTPPYKLTHPAGVVVIEQRLFVIAQDQRVLYGWNLATNKFMGVILEQGQMPERPEQAAIVRCDV